MEAVGETITDSEGNVWHAIRFLNDLPDDLSETEQKGIQILAQEGIKKEKSVMWQNVSPIGGRVKLLLKKVVDKFCGWWYPIQAVAEIV